MLYKMCSLTFVVLAALLIHGAERIDLKLKAVQEVIKNTLQSGEQEEKSIGLISSLKDVDSSVRSAEDITARGEGIEIETYEISGQPSEHVFAQEILDSPGNAQTQNSNFKSSRLRVYVDPKVSGKDNTILETNEVVPESQGAEDTDDDISAELETLKNSNQIQNSNFKSSHLPVYVDPKVNGKDNKILETNVEVPESQGAEDTDDDISAELETLENSNIAMTFFMCLMIFGTFFGFIFEMLQDDTL